jgi:hypothetical protein
VAFHIKESEKLGEWVGVRVGHRRPTLFGEAKEGVIAQVTKILHEEGGGELMVLNRTGKYTEIRQVALGIGDLGSPGSEDRDEYDK